MTISDIQSIFLAKLDNPMEKLVLLALGILSSETGECVLSVSSIAHKCGISIRAVKYAIKNLNSIGFIKISKAGDKITNSYLVNIYKIKHNPLFK